MTTDHILTYDVIVIGAGPVGENVADRTSAAGLSTVLVESELVGGECSYWACEPSKALLRPALLRADAVHVPGIDPAVKNPLDVNAVLAHRDRMSAGWRTTTRSSGSSRPAPTCCVVTDALPGSARCPCRPGTVKRSGCGPGTPWPCAPAAARRCHLCPASRP